MTSDDLREVDISRLEPQPSFRNLVASAMIMTAGERAELKRERFPDNPKFAARTDRLAMFAAPSEIGSDFADAVAWMASRDIMTREQLDAAADAFAAEWGITPERARQYLRERTLALAGAADAGITAQVQALMTHAINQGSTLAEFIGAMETVLDTGNLPGNLGAYWENVFRTEMANAYSEQQRRIESDPDLDSWLWGYEYMNPTDSRSRPGHAALNGKQVKKNSPEFSVIGRPPFSYQCRCAIAPLIEVDPGEFEQTATKSEGAQVERFSSEQPCWVCV
jgi:SPP1 gp7 family putative phage head morphogenesis protein